jgi:hypothetical protein
MIPALLAVAAPLCIYATLIVLLFGLWRARKQLERTTFILAAASFLASLINSCRRWLFWPCPY